MKRLIFLDVTFTATEKRNLFISTDVVVKQVQWVRQKCNLSKDRCQGLFLFICQSRPLADFETMIGCDGDLCFESRQKMCLIKVSILVVSFFFLLALSYSFLECGASGQCSLFSFCLHKASLGKEEMIWKYNASQQV